MYKQLIRMYVNVHICTFAFIFMYKIIFLRVRLIGFIFRGKEDTFPLNFQFFRYLITIFYEENNYKKPSSIPIFLEKI